MAVVSLPACGFQPLYVDQNASGVSKSNIVPFSEISIANIPDREGQYLRNQLVDMIYMDGYPQNPQFNLTIRQLNEQITRLGIQKDATATRAQMRLTAEMQLNDLTDGTILLTRNLIATNSFNILDSQYTTNVSTDYARNRALDELARQVTTQLSLYFQRQ